MGVQERLATSFGMQAEWRHYKASDLSVPNDSRNLASAEALGQPAEYVRGLPDEDPPIVAVQRYEPLVGTIGSVAVAGRRPRQRANWIGLSMQPIELDTELTWYPRANLAELIDEQAVGS